MLKIRVIPTLLFKDVGLVKGVGFDSWRRIGPVVPAVRVYTRRDVDELVLLDIAATTQGRAPDLELVAEVADNATVPLTVGGGISTVSQVARLLEVGADKVSINSAAYDDPSLIGRCADRFGTQCVVASIDIIRVGDRLECVAGSGAWRKGRDPVSWARVVESAGAGEILLTSVDRDGTMSGYDLDVTSEVASAVGIPVIASGGAGGAEDMRQAIQEAGAAAVAAASIFHFTQQTPNQIKAYLASHRVPVRSIDAR
jgi:cyclase